MDIENLDQGSLVRLKSGGPLMTVVRINRETSTVRCIWFTEDNEIRYHYFEVDTLREGV